MKVGCSATKLLDSAKLYSAKWKPGDAMSWMSIKSLFQNRLHMLRATDSLEKSIDHLCLCDCSVDVIQQAGRLP